MKNMQKKWSLFLCLILIVSTLSSCGLFGDAKQEDKGRTDTVETIEGTEGIDSTETDSTETDSTEKAIEDGSTEVTESENAETANGDNSNTEASNHGTQQQSENEESSKQGTQNENSGSNHNNSQNNGSQNNNNQNNSNQGTPGYESSESSTGEQMARNIVNQIIKPGMSDFEKAITIHDWLIFNIDYDFSYSNYDVESTLSTKKAVCQGYALSFEMMAEMAGLEAAFIGGTANNGSGSQSHAWNRVKVDGKWYNVDATWDDPASQGKNPSDHSANRYDYFLISDTQLNVDHSAEMIPSDCGSCSSNYDRLTIYKYAINSGKHGDVALATNANEVNSAIENYMNKEKSTFWLWYYNTSVTEATMWDEIYSMISTCKYPAQTTYAYPPEDGITKYQISVTPMSSWNSIPVVTNVDEFKALLDKNGDAGITSYTVRYESTSGQPVIAASKYGCNVSYTTYNSGNSWLITVNIS